MRIRAFSIVWLILFSLPTLGAHPHMWIDGTIGLKLDSNGLSAIEVLWLFDEFSSADMLLLYDLDRDGKLSAREVERIRDEGFSHLRNRDYFMVAYLGEREVDIPDAQDFHASIRDGRLAYGFTLPLKMAFNGLDGLVVGMFDFSYFVDFLSEPERERYVHQTRTVDLKPVLLRLASEGWGTIETRAVRLQVR